MPGKRYEELPELGNLGVRHARDELDPALGTLSFIGAAEVLHAARLVQQGKTVPLNLPLDAFDPPLFGRSPFTHTLVEPARNEVEDVFDGLNPQASSQIDGLAHVRAREHGFFDGSTELEIARENLGMHHWAERGIAGRAVLLDMTVIESDPFSGRGLTIENIQTVAKDQGVNFREGDILLFYTGWVEKYLSATSPEISGWTGLEASESTAEFLWNQGFAMVGSDNPAIENAPGDPSIGSLHRRLLPALGLPLLELLKFDMLIREARASDRWEYFFVAVPLNARGAVSSTANAMIIL